MTTANTNNRASLLAGLRTGGVRSALDHPHTASPAATFNLTPSFKEDDDHIFHQNISQDTYPHHQPMNPNSIPFTPAFSPPQAQIQMQLLQLEMMRIQVRPLIFIHNLSQFVTLGRSAAVSGNHGSSNPPAASTDSSA